MPVYLCQPGHAAAEPWRHGVQVYAYPFRIDSPAPATASADAATSSATSAAGNARFQSSLTHVVSVGNSDQQSSSRAGGPIRVGDHSISQNAAAATATTTATAGLGPRGRSITAGSSSDAAVLATRAAEMGVGVAIRRVRHSELVLADQVSAAYGRYWLRLRWPGPRGGVAGYIALGVVPREQQQQTQRSGLAIPSASASGITLEGTNAIGERDFRYRTQISEVSDFPAPTSSRQDSLNDVPRQFQRANGADALSSAAAAAAAAEAASAAITAIPPTIDIASGHNRVDGPLSSSGNISEPNSGAATPTAAADISSPNSEKISYPPPKCERTGLYFPSSAAMKLMLAYDDGLVPPSRRRADSVDSDGQGGADAGSDAGRHLGDQIGGIFHHHPRGAGGASIGSIGENDVGGGEPVFCRICREGLHDVNYDLDAVAENNNASGGERNTSGFQAGIVVPPINTTTGGNGDQATGMQAQRPLVPQSAEMAAAAAAATRASAVVAHHPSAENPMLAPCLCTGSMAFVHYLCVEQWRCRSRHPAAKAGLNCETCGGAYTLPPPPSRPVAGAEEADWLEAMPGHVLAALRRPHLWWQIGTAIVRRRWLRPFAPIIMSPIVALYCRARRMLKKRGVSRRRWACSLCRRRARWKCVRCLRSYYCSRQCQNVSWHIVHKHLCYKPVRHLWSTAVYGVGLVLAFPGILRDPVIYDLGLSCLLGSFVIMGVIGGSVATALKRGVGVDIRGRFLELTVVALTFCLASISWGIVWGFFGEPSRCWGAFSDVMSFMPTRDEINADFSEASNAASATIEPTMLSGDGPLFRDAINTFWHQALFRPSKIVIGGLDKAVAKAGPLIKRFICVSNDGGSVAGSSSGPVCLRMAQKANPYFYLPENNGEKCSSDITTVTLVLAFASAAFILSSALKQRERHRRNAAAAVARIAVGGRRAVPRNERQGPRPHQD